MVLGIDALSKDPVFSQQLRTTSTIHVVVVSGFNISLVFGMVVKILGSNYRLKNLVLAQFITLFYAVFTGFEPPVIRAWVMGSIVSWGKYYGRSLDCMRVLFFAGVLMLIFDPKYLFSLSYQLSFMASLGLIAFGSIFQALKFPDDFGSTLSAQLSVWPLISGAFGTTSLVGIFVNPLILWTVPIATILGSIFTAVLLVNGVLAQVLALAVYPFLDIFIKLVEFFSGIGWGNVNFKISPVGSVSYYGLIFLSAVFVRKRIKLEK
jgi:competence protein ComEC